MKRNLISQLAILATAAGLAFSTAAYARDNGGRDGNNGNRDRSDRDSSFFWKDHENGCAVGNTPPPGANCTNRDDQRRRY